MRAFSALVLHVQVERIAAGCAAGILLGIFHGNPAQIAAVDSWTSWTGAANAPRMLGSSSSGRSQVWDTVSHVPVRTFMNLQQAVLSADARIAVGNAATAANITVIRVADGAVLAQITRPNSGQTAFAISADDALVAIDELDANGAAIVVRSTQSGRIVYRLPAAGGGAAFSPDGKTLATLEPKRRAVLLWKAHNGRFERRLTGATGVFGPPLFSPDGRYLLTVANPARTPPHGDGSFQLNPFDENDMRLDVWDLAAGRVVHHIAFGDDRSGAYDESPGYFAFADPHHVVASSRSAYAVSGDVVTGLTARINARGFAVRSGARVEFIDKDAWTEFAGGVLHPILRFPQLVDMTEIAVSAGGLIATVAGDRVFIWDLARAALRCSATLAGQVNDVAFRSADDLALHVNGFAQQVDSRHCKPSRVVTAKPAGGEILSPDGTRVLRYAAPSNDRLQPNLLELRTARTNTLLQTFAGISAEEPLRPHFARRLPIAMLHTDHSPQELIVIDAATGRTILTVPDSPFALSKGGETLASAAHGQTTFYDTRTGHVRAQYDYAEPVFSFTPNAATLVTLTSAGTLRVTTLAGATIATVSVVATRDAEPAWIIELPNGDYVASSTGKAFINGGRIDAVAVRSSLQTALK